MRSAPKPPVLSALPAEKGHFRSIFKSRRPPGGFFHETQTRARAGIRSSHPGPGLLPDSIIAVNFKSPAIQSLAAVLALFLPGPGCSPAPPDPAAAADSATKQDAQGMVWRVSGGKTPFFLAGSFHLLRTSDYPLPASYETAWRESSHLVFEIPPGDAQQPGIAAAIQNLTLLKSGTLPEHIAPATWQDLTQ